MNEQPQLSDAEWALIVELLEWELHDLPAEVHHSRVIRVRDNLRHREEMVKSLLARLRQSATV
jgi:hypothetical protein